VRKLALVLFNRRKRLKERAEAEARGASFWTAGFDNKVRMRLLYAARNATGGATSDAMAMARDLILSDEGMPFLQAANLRPDLDFADHFMKCAHGDMPMAIEALYRSMIIYDNRAGFYATQFNEFRDAVNEILDEERVAYDFEGDQMRSFESKELYQAVLEPALRLLHNSKFQKAEKAYQNALEEQSKGTPGDAITDAGAALQETLSALGCEGNRLDRLIKSARAKGLLAAHDERMTQAIEDVMQWVAADRSEKGDSHKADKAANEDAWFIIHVVGALIVRLVGASGR
jgi:hypothetical protein